MSNKPNLKKRSSTIPRPQAPAAASSALRPNRAWWQSPIVWVGGLVAAALMASLAISAANSGDDAQPDVPQTAAAVVTGAALPPLAEPDPAIGLPAPSIAASTMTGDQVALGSDNTARLYGFFAHWCPHCQAELPRAADWLDKNELPTGVEVVAVSTAVNPDAPNYPPTDWFTREEWPATVLLDSETGDIGNGFGLTTFPYWVAVDADGTVAARASGELDNSQFEALVNTITP